MWEMDSKLILIHIYLFIAISKYIEVNRNSFNHCSPDEQEPEKSAAQAWQYTTLGEQEKMKASGFIFISNQYNTVATLVTHNDAKMANHLTKHF
jgi:hypothetical protein